MNIRFWIVETVFVSIYLSNYLYQPIYLSIYTLVEYYILDYRICLSIYLPIYLSINLACCFTSKCAKKFAEKNYLLNLISQLGFAWLPHYPGGCIYLAWLAKIGPHCEFTRRFFSVFWSLESCLRRSLRSRLDRVLTTSAEYELQNC